MEKEWGTTWIGAFPGLNGRPDAPDTWTIDEVTEALWLTKSDFNENSIKCHFAEMSRLIVEGRRQRKDEEESPAAEAVAAEAAVERAAGRQQRNEAAAAGAAAAEAGAAHTTAEQAAAETAAAANGAADDGGDMQRKDAEHSNVQLSTVRSGT